MTEQNENMQPMTITEQADMNEAPLALTPRREMFHALVRFKAPQEGMITVYAEDKFHARRLITSQFVNREGFEIVDVYAASEIKDQEPVEDVDLADEVLSPNGDNQAEQLTPGMAERIS